MRPLALAAVPPALSLTALAAPALAAPGTGGASTAQASDGPHASRGNDGPRGPQGAKGPKGRRVIAVRPGPPGRTSTSPSSPVASTAPPSPAERRSSATASTLTGAYTWRNLTLPVTPGYPRNTCSVGIKLNGERVHVKVLTTNGDLYETSCTAPALSCTLGWTAIIKP
ncbi:hypothetical protein [Streptomyces sp. NPDC058623]|uniref:hypothetical protein n=1 Tax=Streptomyces sp. NPDC058623 TaxID=3346563 RepID=UPI00365767C0